MHEHVTRVTGSQQPSRSAADERALIARVQSGDPAAFERLFREFAADLASLAYSYLHARDEAEDVVQALFVWLWENRHSFEPQHGVRAYLFGAVRNRSLNALRDARVAASVASAITNDEPERPPSPDEKLVGEDLRLVVEQTVASMPPRCREVFTLVRTRALSYAEVAELLGIAQKTVEVHMGRALAILRARLGPHFER
jgi:RNA polymerase sigma-70 factor (ECF subfamily)